MPSTSAALVSSLEYYMDDLVDCFEDFVKKSLLVISVALGTIILMIMYVLKVLSERAVNQPTATVAPFGPNTGTTAPMNTATWNAATGNRANWNAATGKAASGYTATGYTEGEPERSVSDTTVDSETESTNTNNDTNRYKNAEPISSNYSLNEKTASFSAQVASRPSFDEKVLREIGLSSCSKPCNTSEWTVPQSEPDARNNPNNNKPDTQTCIAKHHLSDARPCLKYIAIRTSCCSMCCVDDDRR